MKQEYFDEYLKYEQLGIKAKEKECMERFINSFETYDEKEAWTIEYLPKLKTNGNSRIRHELFEKIIFPVLLEGYYNRNVKSMVWMVRTIRNLYQNKQLWEKTNYVLGWDLIRECYKIEPDNNDVTDLYLEIMIDAMRFRIHEWPFGILIGNTFAAKDECRKLLEEIPLVRKLDRNQEYTGFIAEYENIVNEYITSP